MSTRVVTAHIPIELAEQVDRLATRLNRPRGWIVKQALASWVALEEKRYQLTREGLTDMDRGQVLDHALVEAWARDLDKPG